MTYTCKYKRVEIIFYNTIQFNREQNSTFYYKQINFDIVFIRILYGVHVIYTLE